METYVFLVLCAMLSSAFTKRYRSDYVYNQDTDAFYKLHTESRSQTSIIISNICKIEGAELMNPSDRRDINQVHSMFKKFPDLGEYVWVADDGQDHESVEEQPLIDLNLVEDSAPMPDKGHCVVVTRSGELETAPCRDQHPFVCKVNANDAPYDRHCGVYGKDYKYFPSVGSCYKIPRIVYTWGEAYSECRMEGAHLVVLNSETEREVVQNLTKTEQRVGGARTSWFFFAGFRANKPTQNAGTSTRREFKTVLNQTLEEAGFSQWSDNEPNNAYGDEYCGSIFKNDGKLNDLNCSHTYAFICEKEVPPINNS